MLRPSLWVNVEQTGTLPKSLAIFENNVPAADTNAMSDRLGEE